MTRAGEREIGAVSGRVGMNNNNLLTAVHESSVHEHVMPFLKPNVKKMYREFFFSLFVLFGLLLTASNLIFDLGLSV